MHTLLTAFRSLIRSPRYALIATLLIALGLGACTTVFSLFDSLLLRDRPGVVNSGTLVDIGRSQNGGSLDNLAYADYADLRDGARTLAGLAAYRLEPVAAGLVIDADAEPAQMQWVTPNYLAVLGTRLALGRDFTPGDKPAAEIILSHHYWQKRFNSDPRAVGRSIVFNRVTVLIAGVAEPGFTGNSIVRPDFLGAAEPVDHQVHPDSHLLSNRANIGFLALGRLQPGATAAQARAAELRRSRAAAREEIIPRPTRVGARQSRPSSRLPGDFGRFAGVFLPVSSPRSRCWRSS